ncbi:FxSxx-COOH system tetratricopeptide repeat protein [Streptomycetaceae bacterium NBC_01309]
MNRWRHRKRPAETDAATTGAGAPAVSATGGSNAAGRDQFNPVAIHAEFALPAEAYAPIPDDAAVCGVSNIPRTALFVGRGGDLERLDAAFADTGEVVVHAVHGLGGVGKSALAAHWAARRNEAVRWWITADTTAAIDAGTAALARALQPGLAALPAELQIERAVAWLAAHDRWLLVLDNVENPDHIRPLLDRAPNGRVLVTTRRATGWHHHATTLCLGVLEPADAVDLFTRILTHHGPRDPSGADAVCAELGHLALAVEQAAAYCAETGTAPTAYLDMLAKWPAAMYSAAAECGDAERTIARIWRVTLDTLADTPDAGDLLRTLAWYAPDNIPRDLFAPVAEPALTRALGRLTAYSMVTDNHDGSLGVHRLVQALARTPDADDPHRQADDIGNARDQAISLLALAFPDSHEQPEDWPRYRVLLPHLEVLTRHHPPDQDSAVTAYALDRAATYQRGQGHLTPATHAFERSLAASLRVQGSDHPSTLAVRTNLAGAYQAAGDFGRAISLFERTLKDTERVLGTDHPDTLVSRNNLAAAYQYAGDLGRATPLHEQSVNDIERILGADHPHTLTARSNLAGAYQTAGDLDHAVRLFERVLKDRQRVLGTDHPDTLIACTILAGAYREAGDLDRAIPLSEQCLDHFERVLGTDHPDTLVSRANLAGAYRAAGDLDRAIPLSEQVLNDRQRVLGPEHPDTLTARTNLAYGYRAAGDLDRAVPLSEQSLSDAERVLGADHPNMLVSRSNLAGAYRAAGDPARAIPLYEQVLTQAQQVLSPGHPFFALIQADLERARAT